MKKISLAVFALVAAITLVAGAAFATMDLQKEFLAKYPDSKIKCGSCHTKAMPKKGEADVNKFGADMNKLKGKDGKYDFAALDKMDSDGDGVSNGDELKKGTNPGDPASK
ncbi:MAG TPA: thrombospondin type 3 repeat-containing protein [Thermoanaerobaculia bacterium]|jgi:cytochrome c553